jgi:Tol biopolymer transport system component
MTRPHRPRPSLSRFGLVVGILSLALALATVGVILRGDQVNLAPLDVSPDPAAAAVSTGASLHIRFARPMKPRTVEERLRLEPPVAGAFGWAGTTLTFTPQQALQPATDYVAVLEPGVEEAQGRVSRQPYAWRFRTRTPAVVTRQHRDGVANLWLVDPAGGAARQVTHERTDVLDFSLAPDGDRLVYARQDFPPTKASLWVADLRSGAITRLSPDEDASFTAPAWSPRGDLILFERRQALGSASGTPKLFAARADGTPGSLVYGRGDEVGFGARWSPDGTRLAFFDGLNPRVVIFNFTRDLVSIPVETAVAFDWSPDGRHLVIEDIIVEGNGFRHILVVADAATGATRRLSQEAGSDDASPSWSPDGTRIAFTRRATTDVIGGSQPWLMTPDGQQAQPLLATPEPGLETLSLDWSPDGRRLLLVRQPLADARAQAQLWLVDARPGATPQRLADGAVAAWLP